MVTLTEAQRDELSMRILPLAMDSIFIHNPDAARFSRDELTEVVFEATKHFADYIENISKSDYVEITDEIISAGTSNAVAILVLFIESQVGTDDN